jgi:hypothetical protein
MNDRLWTIFSSTNEWLRYSDGKAVALLGIQGILIGLAVAVLPNVFSSDKSVASMVFLILGFISIVASVIFTFLTFNPRLKSSGNISPIYFKSISSSFSDSDHYVQFIKEKFTVDSDVTDAIAEQIHTNSRIATAKFKWLSWSMSFLFIGFGLWVVSVIIDLW